MSIEQSSVKTGLGFNKSERNTTKYEQITQEVSVGQDQGLLLLVQINIHQQEYYLRRMQEEEYDRIEEDAEASIVYKTTTTPD